MPHSTSELVLYRVAVRLVRPDPPRFVKFLG
jgi:hypothetical protein